MMLVTMLTPKGRTKTIVGIDYDQTVVLSNRDLIRYGIREGAELSQEQWEELLGSLRAGALRKCGSLLKSMDYTEYGLSAKLTGYGYPEPVVREAVSEMRSAGYVDDRRYAKDYLNYHMQDRSRLRMRMELKGRGVPEPLLEEVYGAWESENLQKIEENELRQIRSLMEKRHFDAAEASREDEQKLISFLQGKGYSHDIIRRALRPAADADE